MKKINKNEICKECGKICKGLKGLVGHIRHSHDKKYKEYYDKWIKEKNEGYCKICNNVALFKNMDYGYLSGCCRKHIYEWNKIQIKKAVKLKYDVDNVYQLQETKDKTKKTCLRKYGVEYTHQNNEIFQKAFKTGLKILQYKNTNLFYQGSYELDFLEKFYNKCIIKSAPNINYIIDNEKHVYHPDFYIPFLNLIIECKSTYYYKKHKNVVDIKAKATIANGFNYFMILDKNYNIFEHALEAGLQKIIKNELIV
jgi:hypothetical protein